MEPFVFTISSEHSLTELQQQFEKDSDYDLEIVSGELAVAVVLDTFDNEIRLAGKILLQTDNHRLLLINLQSGMVAEQKTASTWSFWPELADGPVSRLLKKVSRLRAVREVAKVRLRRDRGVVLDDEGKTRVRLHWLSFCRKKRYVQLGITQPLRGYATSHAELKNKLLNTGGESCRGVAEIYRQLAIKLKDYSAKPDILISGGDAIKENVTAIVRTYIDVARRNENGLIADYDTEFLHDYRVSFRKVRSCLSLFDGVFGAAETALLKQEIASHMKQTNRLRDLDVYLLNREDYFELVPKSSHEGLGLMFESFAQERKKEHKKVCKIIKSKSYRLVIGRWTKQFAAVDNIADGAKSEERSDLYAAKLILKRYRKVCKIARSIDKTTADDVVHELRIHCKKLRYLMEFSAPLFAGKKVKYLIKSLKVLQDNLGLFNDYSVQQVSLSHYMAEHSLTGSKAMKVAESIGALTAMLYQLQGQERKLVIENFSHFDSEKIRSSFAELFVIAKDY